MAWYVAFTRLEPGMVLPPLTLEPITKVQLVRYAGASGDFNPIHTDDETARKSGLTGVIAQGILIMGLVGRAITMWAPRRSLKRFKVRFLGMTFPGDTLTVEAVVAQKIVEDQGVRVTCDTSVKDQNRVIKLSGSFELLVPKD